MRDQARGEETKIPRSKTNKHMNMKYKSLCGTRPIVLAPELVLRTINELSAS